MLRNCAKSVVSLSTPRFVVFNNYLKLSVPEMASETLDSLTFKSTEVSNVMKFETLQTLGSKYGRNVDMNYYKKYFDDVDSLINYGLEQNLQNGGNVDPKMIKQDICDHSFFNSPDRWNVTNLIRKYNLSSFDVFQTLVSASIPFNAGVLSHTPSKMNIDEMKKDFYRETESGYRYFDYWNGIGLKSSFPIDVNNNVTPFELNMRRYNDRNSNLGFYKIIKLLSNNVEKRTDDFVKYIPTIKEVIDYKHGETIIDAAFPTIESLFEKDTKINNYVALLTKNILTDKNMKEKKQTYWSHRFTFDGDCKWDYQVTPYYQKYVKNNIQSLSDTFELKTFDISKEVGEIQLSYNHKIPIEHMSMVNMLMFGRTNVTFAFLERLLSFVRYSEDSSSFQLDNYLLDKSNYAFSNGDRRYDVVWREDNINNLKFAQTDYEKLYVAKNLIQLMNEVDPSVLNYHNYVMIAEWYRLNDVPIQFSHSSQYGAMSRASSKEKLYKELK